VNDHYVVTFQDLLEAHDEALTRGGGVIGIKDENLLHSAIGRPYHESFGHVLYPTVVDKAGCLLHSLLHNHGFNDASKRTAWLVCNGFLYQECCGFVLPEGYPWYDKLAEMVETHWDVTEVTEWMENFVESFDSYEELDTRAALRWD
jgi:death-on-curing protein